MKAQIVKINKKRRFSDSFRKQIVSDYEKGLFSVPELEKLHNIGNSLIYRWIYKYSSVNQKNTQIVEMKDSSSKKVKELEKRIKELERAVGVKQLNIDYLEKMIELAKEELGIDIKKNFDTPQSSGSGPIGKE